MPHRESRTEGDTVGGKARQGSHWGLLFPMEPMVLLGSDPMGTGENSEKAKEAIRGA
jgi:hypothetical protein